MHILIFFIYAPLVVVAVNTVSERSQLSTGWAYAVVIMLCGWLVTIHALLAVADSRILGQKLRQSSFEALLKEQQMSPPIEVYNAAVKESESITNVQDVTERVVRDILEDTAEALLADVKQREYEGRNIVGWSQFFDARSMPSAIGSSYGLRLALALNLSDPRVDFRAVSESILSLERPEGGWSARSQRGRRGHIEVTAWVLPPLLRTGVTASDRARLVSSFEQLLDDHDEVGLNSTTVVATALAALTQIFPESKMMSVLRDKLAGGARAVDNHLGSAVAWTTTLDHTSTQLSAAHTARALVALHGTSVSRPTRNLTDLLRSGINWLKAKPDFTLFDEVIRRPVGTSTDEIVVGHFTPAWVARALMAVDETPDDLTVLREAVRLVVARQDRGTWLWHVGSNKPLWMAYQGTVAIQEYAMRNLPWPP